MLTPTPHLIQITANNIYRFYDWSSYQQLTIGRDSSNDIVLPFHDVCSHHATMLFHRELCSMVIIPNHTVCVNDDELAIGIPRILQNSDVIQISEFVVFKFVY